MVGVLVHSNNRSCVFPLQVLEHFSHAVQITSAVVLIPAVSTFRYCTQILDKDIDSCCTTLLQDLVRFQDRLYHKDPVKVRLPAQKEPEIWPQKHQLG